MRGNDMSEVNYTQEREVRINLKTIFYDLVRYWWILAAGLIMAVMLSYVFITETYEAEYSSTATFVVSTKGSTSSTMFSNLRTSKSLAEGFERLLVSNTLREKALEAVGIDSFSGTIKSELIEDTNLLTLAVTADSPKLAFSVINAIIDNHSIVSEVIMKNASIQLLEAPEVAKAPLVAMNRGARVRTYTFFGFFAIAACVAAYSIFSDVIRSEDDFTDKVEPERIATIHRERLKKKLKAAAKKRRQGNKSSWIPIVSNPTTSFGFTETYRLLRMRIGYMMAKRGDKALLVTSMLDSEGKSTVAINLAVMFAMDGKRVLLMEANMLKPSLERMLECRVENDNSIDEFVMFPKTYVKFPTLPGYSNVSLLLCKRPLNNSTEILSSTEMQEFIKYAKSNFDYIIIDTPAFSVSSDAECAAELADAAIIVTRQGMPTAKSVNDAADTIEQSGAEVLGCVFNNVKNTNAEGIFGLKKDGYGYGYSNSYGRYGRYGAYRSYASKAKVEGEGNDM